MNQIFLRKCVDRRHSFAGRDWWYEFGDKVRTFEEKRVTKYISRQQRDFAKLARNWTDDLNTEWTCRVFLAARMILAASVMLSSLSYARSANLRICVPYLQYYSLLYSLKSLVLLAPTQTWHEGQGKIQTHEATINAACEEMVLLDAYWKKPKDNLPSVNQQILELKAFREFISYRAPSSGGSLKQYEIDVVPMCRVLVEVAQMSSELLESSLAKHAPSDYEPKLIAEALDLVDTATIHDTTFYDGEDAYRIGYLARKHPYPANIQHIMSEGHVEDFFGSWCDPENREGVFDPDADWGIIFDVP